ncbi:MAG: ATP-binding protein [candidate division WOR-3 bacterium]
MRELSISFVLLFLLFVCLDVSTTFYSFRIREVLFEEIDNRIILAGEKLKKEINKSGRITLDLKKVYSTINECSLDWIEVFDSNKNLVLNSDFKVRFIPEIFPDTANFWGERYGLIPFDAGYLLIKTSDKELSLLKGIFRFSFFLKAMVYFSFFALGFYIFWVFSYPFKKVRELTGGKKQSIEEGMRMIREMIKDYREKLKSVEEREKEVRQRLFLLRLGENVSQVLHEIRNATGTILGLGKLVNDEKIKEGILEETKKLNDFSAHLLSLAGPLKLKKEKTNIKELINDVIHRLDNKMNVEIKTKIPEKLILKLDRELIEKAIYNILDNALDACKEKGEIYITVEEKKKGINILIKDTGIGMDRKTLSSIFNLFFTKKDGGVGVGMAVTKRIVESHGGDIKVKSKKGKGSSFLLTLPFEE